VVRLAEQNCDRDSTISAVSGAKTTGAPAPEALPCGALNFAAQTLSSKPMRITFTKMNGAGNDFILLDNRSGNIQLTASDVIRLCDRHRGIGADGVLILVPGPAGGPDWAWEFYNSDGSAAGMCGNGARCFARFVNRVTGAGPEIKFATGAGLIRAVIKGEKVTVDLTPPRDYRPNVKLSLTSGSCEAHSINTGVPHAVVFVADVSTVPVAQLGAEIRRHPEFAPAGTNVNFVQILEPGYIRVRTFERGVEGETLACGTGVSASALVCALTKGFASPVKVKVQGGDTLEVAFESNAGGFRKVSLTGPAEFVFDGQIEL